MPDLETERTELEGCSVELQRLPDGTLVRVGIWYIDTDGYIEVADHDAIQNFYEKQGVNYVFGL